MYFMSDPVLLLPIKICFIVDSLHWRRTNAFVSYPPLPEEMMELLLRQETRVETGDSEENTAPGIFSSDVSNWQISCETKAGVTEDSRVELRTLFSDSATLVSSSGMYNYGVISHIEEIILHRVYLWLMSLVWQYKSCTLLQNRVVTGCVVG